MKHRPTLITDARVGRTIDADARTRRYLWTMGFRLACILAMLVTPGWWRLVLLIAAAVLPAIGVLLANAADRRSARTPVEDLPRTALAAGPVIPGSVEEPAAKD